MVLKSTGGSDRKESVYNARDLVSMPGSGRSPGGGNGNLFQYSCLENPMDRGAWQAMVHGVAESDMTERLTLSLFTAFRQASGIILSDHILNQREYLGGDLQRPASGIPFWRKPCFVLHSDGNSVPYAG